MKTHTTLTTAAITMLVAIMMLCVVASPALGESQTATDVTGFDSYDAGTTNEDVYYVSSPYSISLIVSGGVFEFNDFIACDIDFSIYCENYGDSGTGGELEIEIVDSEDSSNKVEIYIWASGAASSKVRVKDSYEGASTSETKDCTTDISDAWATVSIAFTKTTAGTDGTKQQISIDVGSDEVFDNYELETGELGINIGARKWNNVEFNNADDTELYVDNIDIDTTEITATSFGAYNLTWIIIALFIVTLIVVRHFKIWPLNGNVGFLNIITRGKSVKKGN